MRTTLARSILLVVLLGSGCGSVTPTIDASAVIDGPVVIDAPPVIDAPTGTIDAAIDGPIDAGIDGPSCVWIAVSACDSGGTIAQFCPANTRVGDLRRCDGTTFTPDLQYQQFHLCNCSFQTCGCNGVAWRDVQCCN